MLSKFPSTQLPVMERREIRCLLIKFPAKQMLVLGQEQKNEGNICWEICDKLDR